MYEFLKNVDRRWIFLLMGLAIALPILFQLQFPEVPTGLAMAVFDEVEAQEAKTNGDRRPRVLMAFDYDPGSEGELGPMARAFTLHCAMKDYQMYFLCLWPAAPPMIRQSIDGVIKSEFTGKPGYKDLEYGVDYVNLGYKTGNEGVIKVIITDLPQLISNDIDGTPLSEIPMMKGISNVQDFDLIINVSAGYPGTKEWIQYAVSPYQDKLSIVSGCTGVQAPLFYPYVPQQMPGLLGAIKGAAEYEALVLEKYGAELKKRMDLPEDAEIPGKYTEAQRRMGPQLIAHVLMIILIIVGNIVFFMSKKEGRR